MKIAIWLLLKICIPTAGFPPRRKADLGQAGALVWEVVRGAALEHELESGTLLLCLRIQILP